MSTDTEHREFVDVSQVHATNMGIPWQSYMRETITVRTHSGRVIDVLHVTPDGHYHGTYGKVRREDVGEFMLRLMGRMPC
jgi:hypothetical protein